MAEPRVLVLLDSTDERPVARETIRILDELDIPHSAHVASAHRSPQRLSQLVKDSPARIIVTIATDAATTADVVSAMTMRPVIGVPVSAGKNEVARQGAHAPTGAPAAMVGPDRGDNAALMAAAIIALSDDRVQSALAAHRERELEKIMAQDRDLQSELGGP